MVKLKIRRASARIASHANALADHNPNANARWGEGREERARHAARVRS